MKAAKPLRSDAAENRERVLAAAVTAVLREGQNVPLATIAAEANVGVGTLYRRYPNREALLVALEIRAYGIVLESLTDILARDETGYRQIERFLERTILTRSQLVLPFHGAPDTDNPEAVELRAEVESLVAAIVERGHDDGTVRYRETVHGGAIVRGTATVRDGATEPGVTARDVIVFGAMIAQPLPHVPEWNDVARAQVQVFLRGIAGPSARAGANTSTTAPSTHTATTTASLT
ncbi:MAG: regulatory protein TetR [Subtercola sp.]|nr:regulatory protein TetR [Subtercola sp.]